MNFQDKVYNLRLEIEKDLKELILKYGTIDEDSLTGDKFLDCWGFRPANSCSTIRYIEYNQFMGVSLKIDGVEGLVLSGITDLSILASVADTLHNYYNDNNVIKKTDGEN